MGRGKTEGGFRRIDGHRSHIPKGDLKFVAKLKDKLDLQAEYLMRKYGTKKLKDE